MCACAAKVTVRTVPSQDADTVEKLLLQHVQHTFEARRSYNTLTAKVRATHHKELQQDLGV